MRRALIRISKSKAAWESGDSEQVMKSNFRLRDGSWDLRPSVYELTEASETDLRASVLRAHVQHVVSFLGPPASGAMHHIDASEQRARVEPSKGKTAFAFANDAHREVVFDDESGLRGFVEAILETLTSAAHEITLADVLGHVASNAAQQEWTEASAHPNVAKWIALARKKAATK